MTGASPWIGKAWRFGRNVNTDIIFPGWMLGRVKGLDDLAPGAMAGIDPEFHKKTSPGDMVIAEENFGCGSSRESAALCLKHAGIRAVVAKSFGQIFYRNCVNVGLWPLICKDVTQIQTGQELQIDPRAGTLTDQIRRIICPVQFPDPFCVAIINGGGLMAFLRANNWSLHSNQAP